MMSSVSARRRYFDRSSLISDRATCFIAFTMFRKPGIHFGFRHDSQDLDHPFGYIVKHSKIVTDAKAVLGLRQPAQSLDAASAHLGGLMPQVLLDGITHRGADTRLEIVQVLDRFRSQHDGVGHSGYN